VCAGSACELIDRHRARGQQVSDVKIRYHMYHLAQPDASQTIHPLKFQQLSAARAGLWFALVERHGLAP